MSTQDRRPSRHDNGGDLRPRSNRRVRSASARRRLLRLALVVAVAATMLVSASPGPSAEPNAKTIPDGKAEVIPVGTDIALELNEPRYWKVPNIEREQMLLHQSPLQPRAIPRETREWGLLVPEGGWRLRVGVEHPDPTDRVTIELVDPDGRAIRDFTDWDTAEVMVWDAGEGTPRRQPQAGRWTVRLLSTNVTDTAVVLRALVEEEPLVPTRGGEYLPNLRAEPPFDLGFRIEELATGSRPAPVSCQPEETVEDRLVRCLRFAFGYQNAGRGPYELRLKPRITSPSDPGDVRVADAVQRIYREDGTQWSFVDNDDNGAFRDVAAGTATFHEAHGHWHYDNIVEIDLFAVDGNALKVVGPAAKRGACAHDWVLVDFDRWYQDDRFRHDSSRQAGNNRPIADTGHTVDDFDRCNSALPHENLPGQPIAIALSPGWGDIYGINNSDNYVEFPILTDGTFLLRMRIDGGGLIEEAREDDNVGYAYFSVTGDNVTLLERGRGTDPWDPTKRVLPPTGLGE